MASQRISAFPYFPKRLILPTSSSGRGAISGTTGTVRSRCCSLSHSDHLRLSALSNFRRAAAAASANNILGYRDYDTVPEADFRTDGANSNSAAYAAAKDADRISGSRRAGASTPKPSVSTPGAGASDRVQRRCLDLRSAEQGGTC